MGCSIAKNVPTQQGRIFKTTRSLSLKMFAMLRRQMASPDSLLAW